MEDLPKDLRLEIFSRLPEPLLKCKLVCKTWEDNLSHKKVGILFLLRSSKERNLQLYYGEYDDIFRKINSEKEECSFKSLTKINHPAVNRRKRHHFVDQMVGSCNGLVCFRVPHHAVNDPVYICNPITREYINLPRMRFKYGYVVSGFGYHPLSCEYKVIRIHYRDRPDCYTPVTKGFVEIYTLGRDTGWRSLGEVTYTLNKRGVLANGSIYWLDYDKFKIVVFDLADEKFRWLPSMPQCFGGSEDFEYQIKVLGGNLCFVRSVGGEQLDIWSYKNKQMKIGDKEEGNQKTGDKEEGNHSWSWNLEFHMPCSIINGNFYDPFALTKNNDVLMWNGRGGLSCFNVKTNTMNDMLDEEVNDLINFQGIPHMNNPLSMKSLGGKVKTIKDKSKKKKMPKTGKIVDD